MNRWTVCLNKLVKFVFFKKVLIRVFFTKKHSSAENVLFFQIFLHITLFFYKHSGFFFLVFFLEAVKDQTQHAYWAFYFAYKICSNFLDHSKSMYALMEGIGGTPKTCENVQEEGRYSKVYVNRKCSFKRVFSHLNCLFLLLTSLMGKWKL